MRNTYQKNQTGSTQFIFVSTLQPDLLHCMQAYFSDIGRWIQHNYIYYLFSMYFIYGEVIIILFSGFTISLPQIVNHDIQNVLSIF